MQNDNERILDNAQHETDIIVGKPNDQVKLGQESMHDGETSHCGVKETIGTQHLVYCLRKDATTIYNTKTNGYHKTN